MPLASGASLGHCLVTALYGKRGRGRCAGVTTSVVLALSALCPPTLHGQGATPVNRVIVRLQQGRPAIGTFSRSPDDHLDFTVIDAQYGEFDIEAIRQVLSRMRPADEPPAVAPIVRIPVAVRHAPRDVVTQLLDLGAFGVMFPDIETPEQAMNAIGAMRYASAPLGGNERPATGGQRGTGSGTAPGYWGVAEDEYRARADVWPLNPSGQLVAVLQIESLAGIERLDEILDVPGIGALFLGPTDLAASIGADGPDAPEVEALVQRVLSGCLARNVPCGYPIVARTPDEADRETTRRLREGFRMLAVMTTAQ
jgi:4-hydroxy-2-oxoheptanedioate aldolase